MEWISKLELPKEAELVDGRLAVQQRFKIAMQFLAPLSGLINRVNVRYKKGKTAMGRAMASVLHGAIEGEYPNQFVNPAKVLLCQGTLALPFKLTATRMGEFVLLDYQDNFSHLICGNADDEIVICVYNPDLRIAGMNDEPATRMDGKVSIRLPVQLRDTPVHMYCLVHSRDWKQFSRSVYLGEY